MQVLLLTGGRNNRAVVHPAANKVFLYQYAWDMATVQSYFNDQSQLSNILTTNNPSDPLTYLTYDAAYISNVSTAFLGNGQWVINYTATGSEAPVNTNIMAGLATLQVQLPGYLIYDYILTPTLPDPGLYSFTSFAGPYTSGTPLPNMTVVNGTNLWWNAASVTGYTVNLPAIIEVSDNRMRLTGFATSAHLIDNSTINAPVNHVITATINFSEIGSMITGAAYFTSLFNVPFNFVFNVQFGV